MDVLYALDLPQKSIYQQDISGHTAPKLAYDRPLPQWSGARD